MGNEDANRPFNIQAEDGIPPGTVPWWLAKQAYLEYQKRYGSDQSLETLHERGGFGATEFLKLLRRER